MSARQWCPMPWLDEVVAVAVADPSDCVRLVDGKWLLTDDDWRDTNGAEGAAEELTVGEIVLFGYSEHRGRVELIKHDDGSFSRGGDIPTDVTSWWIVGDADTMSDSLDELVRNNMDAGDQCTVEGYKWDYNIPFVFEADGRLVAVPTPEPAAS